MPEPWRMTKADIGDCRSLDDIEARILARIDVSLAESDAEELEVLRSRGATAAELADHKSWRREVTARWRAATARKLSIFLRDADFGGELH